MATKVDKRVGQNCLCRVDRKREAGRKGGGVEGGGGCGCGVEPLAH